MPTASPSPTGAQERSQILNKELAFSVLMSRLLLVAFLEERNAELARSIRRAAAETQAPVVAILGGLHVNGVARCLLSEAVPDADTRVTDRIGHRSMLLEIDCSWHAVLCSSVLLNYELAKTSEGHFESSKTRRDLRRADRTRGTPSP